MPIIELPDHSCEQFVSQIAMVLDALRRAGDQVTIEFWNRGDLGYTIDQLEKARRYLWAAKSVAEAQRLSVQ